MEIRIYVPSAEFLNRIPLLGCQDNKKKEEIYNLRND